MLNLYIYIYIYCFNYISVNFQYGYIFSYRRESHDTSLVHTKYSWNMQTGAIIKTFNFQMTDASREQICHLI